jgi:UDP-2,3-diacylglucosamine hydrolase
MPNRVYFISDAHIGWGSEEEDRARQDRLIDFLRAIREDAEALYVVGDLFDFWFEYRSVVPRSGARVLFELYNLIEAGVPVGCTPGNHDLWIGTFLSREVGVTLLPRRSVVHHQGVRICLDHGDDLLGGGLYRLVKRVLLNPACIALFRLLHPDLGALLARMTSGRPTLGTALGGHTVEIYRREAHRRFGEEADVVVFGHLHRPVLHRDEEGTFVVLGDWIEHFSYAVMENGRIEVKKWENRPES